jgi:hypothetical protein
MRSVFSRASSTYWFPGGRGCLAEVDDLRAVATLDLGAARDHRLDRDLAQLPALLLDRVREVIAGRHRRRCGRRLRWRRVGLHRERRQPGDHREAS